jgi:hypothetical protein
LPRRGQHQDDADFSALFEAWETPTLRPPFDLQDFARDTTGPLEGREAASERPTDPGPEEDPTESITRLRTHPPLALTELGVPDLRAGFADEFLEGNYSLALPLAEELVSRRPDDISARDFLEECRRMMEKEYLERIGGSVGSVPLLAISIQELQRHALDHRAGFVVSRVDGESSIEALLDVGAMPRLEALRIIAQLVEAGVLRLTD